MTEPYEARRLPEVDTDTPAVADAARNLLTAVNGFPCPGESADALMYGLRWMRANPNRADVLLGRK